MKKNNGNEVYWEIQRTLGWEFSRYILAHPEITGIPDGAEIVFQIKDNAEFNAWAKEVARTQHESGRPIVIIEVEGLAPPPPVESRLINPHVELATSI
jgi:hypothetical protein